MIAIDWNPSDRMLRQFGAMALIVFPLAAWFFMGSSSRTGLAIGVGLGLICGFLAWLKPQWLKPLFLGLSVIAYPIGRVVGELSVICIFFGIFTPLALVFRLMGRDSLNRKWDPSANSYWRTKTLSDDPRRSFRQF